MRKLGSCFLLVLSLASLSMAASGKVNVNTATASELQLLYRVGPKMAERIASMRPYKGQEDLDKVPGIGPAFLAVNGEYIAYDGPTTLKAKVAKAPATQANAQ